MGLGRCQRCGRTADLRPPGPPDSYLPKRHRRQRRRPVCQAKGRDRGRRNRQCLRRRHGELPGGEVRLRRQLSARVFFNSFESLVPRGDANGKADVYQWEAPGAGSCSESSPAYSPPNGGCLSLISSGESPTDSVFLDASQSGGDVFFSTASSLLPQDPGLIDIYDARAGGGYPPLAPLPAQCEGDACQGAPAAPNDPTPASSSFEGATPRKHQPAAVPKASARSGGPAKPVASRRRRSTEPTASGEAGYSSAGVGPSQFGLTKGFSLMPRAGFEPAAYSLGGAICQAPIWLDPGVSLDYADCGGDKRGR
jgi:hypothetical protein